MLATESAALSGSIVGVTSSGESSIAALLASLPDERPTWIPPEYKVVRRTEVIAGGGDPATIEAWLAEVGGEVRSSPRELLGGEAVWRPKDDALVYVVPRAALA